MTAPCQTNRNRLPSPPSSPISSIDLVSLSGRDLSRDRNSARPDRNSWPSRFVSTPQRAEIARSDCWIAKHSAPLERGSKPQRVDLPPFHPKGGERLITVDDRRRERGRVGTRRSPAVAHSRIKRARRSVAGRSGPNYRVRDAMGYVCLPSPAKSLIYKQTQLFIIYLTRHSASATARRSLRIATGGGGPRPVRGSHLSIKPRKSTKFSGKTSGGN